MSVVQIDVWDPTNGPKIFDSLNSRQEPMTTGDLVRNEIFSRVADEHPQDIDLVDQRSWQPFYNKFRHGDESYFDAYFFPFGLIQNPNLRKSEVYSYLRDSWKEIDDPEVIVGHLREYQDAFLDVVCGSNRQGHSQSVARALRELWEMGTPSSAYPFMMRLSNAVKMHEVSEDDGVEVLGTIQSFLVRRAICGHEPTGLHAVFKRLWDDCNAHPTEGSVTAAIRAHRTVVWPTDHDLHRSVEERDLYGSEITKYVLLELNRSRGGDQPGIDTRMWIEHVLPDNPAPEWFDSFSEEQHERMKHLLANLLPLSAEMNQALSNRPFAEKREVYRSDSVYKVAREFGERQSWGPTDLSARSRELKDWVTSRWSR